MSALTVSLRDWVANRAPPLARGLRLVDRVRAQVLLRECKVGSDVVVHGPLGVNIEGEAHIGPRCCFVSGPVPTTLRVARGGTLDIGEACYFNYGVSLDVKQSVRVGPRCMFGSYVHLGDATRRGSKPIVLGHDVWVAHGAVIEPGVTIGDGAVIAAGAVVTEDVPAGMLAMGNPARLMSQQLAQSS